MSKPPLFFIVIIGLIVVAASFRFMQQRREKADNDMAPLQQKLVVVSNKREKPINDRRSRQQEVTPAGTSMRYEASFKPQSGGMYKGNLKIFLSKARKARIVRQGHFLLYIHMPHGNTSTPTAQQKAPAC